MNEFEVLMVLFAICVVLSGPAALIIAIIALKKVQRLSNQAKRAELGGTDVEAAFSPIKTKQKPVEVKSEQAIKSSIKTKPNKPTDTPRQTLEQQIGTKWILFAGIITVIVGVGFFMKYAYDNSLIGAFGRVVIVAITGVAALIIGEITRRRDYGVVARGVSALGYAILYAAVFSAYRFYELINSPTAFVLAILITAAAMLYAVALDEVLIAVLSLLGGFAAPVIVSTGENKPIALFSYLLVLGLGAMLCAYYRRWRFVNALAFAGTIFLYVAWLSKYYMPAETIAGEFPEQFWVAISWISIFFVLYLILPLLNGFVRSKPAEKIDVFLVFANAVGAFVCFWAILFTDYKIALAFTTIVLCGCHLLMLKTAIKKNSRDSNLQIALLAISLFFLTIAIPLYLEMYAIAAAWAIEAAVLTAIGLRYKSLWTLSCGFITLLLSLGQLVHKLPMHSGHFTVFANRVFGSWALLAAMIFVCYYIYRRNQEGVFKVLIGYVLQILYCFGVILALFAIITEWVYHCVNNISADYDDKMLVLGIILAWSVAMGVLCWRKISPAGALPRVVVVILGLLGTIFTAMGLPESYYEAFTLFANINFIIFLFAAGMMILSSRLLLQGDNVLYVDKTAANMLGFISIILLWVVLLEQMYMFWYYRNQSIGVDNWRFVAGMYMSVIWAAYAAGLLVLGFWRKLAGVRYISLGLFVVLLSRCLSWI